MKRKEDGCFSFSAILFFVSLMSALVFADTDPNGPYGIAPEQITNYTASSINSHIGLVYAAGMYGASTTLAYSSYIFTTEDIVLFSYEDGTQLEVYDSSGNSISFTPDVLDKGEHVRVDTSQGIYLVAGSNKFAVLTGDATTVGVSGYYVMDADGRGASEEFYTYVPTLQGTSGHSAFIVFAYQDSTTVTIQQEVSIGVYTNIATVSLDKGEHWADSSISNKYLHITADKFVSALTCHDQSYFVPSADGRWSGTEFYTYVSDIGISGYAWPEDLTVIAYDDNTLVSIKNNGTQETIWEGILDNGQSYVEPYPNGANKYFTITASSPITVSVQPWESATSGYYQSVFVPDRNGTGIGTDLIGSTLGGGYLYILAHTDNTHIDLYDSRTGVWQADYTLNTGQSVNANPGNGLWRIISDKAVSVYSGWGNEAISQFAPLSFNKSPMILEKDDDVADGDCRSPLSIFVYEISWENPGTETIEDVNLVDFLPDGVDFDDFISAIVYQPITPPLADPNVIYGITDANSLTDITLPVGQSVRLYLTKETFEEDVVSFYLEADISDPNLGWIDNTEYDPNNPGTAEILAQPRASFFDYYGPGYTQPEGIQFFAANLGNAIQDGNLASFVYTATQPGYVVLTLVDYNAVPATLEEIIIRQTDPNDPNYVPEEPNEVEEPPGYSASSVSGVYNEPNHTVIWELGDIAPGGYGSVSFSVIVNEKAEPGMNLYNVAKMISQNRVIARAPEDTPVCCWDTTDPNIIFVDKYANGNNNGTSWTDAYTDLQDALYRAENTACENVDTIFLAQGVYSPGDNTNDSFEIPDGISVYGGFAGWETSPEQRHIEANPTILTGRIDPNNRNETVVVMGDNSLLSGVIVQDGQDGIHCEGIGTTASIFNCLIEENQRNGCSFIDSAAILKNNVIAKNGGDASGDYYGLCFDNSSQVPVMYNNTFVGNYKQAVAMLSADPNYPKYPDIQNCILWYNNNGGEQLYGYEHTQYSCVYDPNDPNGVSEAIDPNNHNFSHKPDFAYPYSTDPNVCINVHLAYDSFCKNKGNPNLSYEGQTDIDNEERVADSVVDVGADEVYCSEISNAFDWDADGIVGMPEFNKFSQNWLAHDPNDPAVLDPNSPESDPNSPSYIDPNRLERWYPDGHKYNFSTDEDSAYSIDVADLLVFLEEAPWTWTACWRHDIEDMQQQMSMLALSNAEGLAPSGSEEITPSVPSISMEISQPVEATVSVPVTESVEAVETDPAAEREQVLSLLEDIEALIDAGGDDANLWLEIKNLLEQTLVETEDTVNEPNEF